MIVSEEEVALVKRGKRRELWLPVERGSMGQRKACPLELHQVVPLQTRPFEKGVKISIHEAPVLTTLGYMTLDSARRQGYLNLTDARMHWERSYGRWSEDREAWAVQFVLGDFTRFFQSEPERYLRAKMGGARAYTTRPEEAVGGARDAGLNAVPYEEDMRNARNAAAQRAAAAHTVAVEMLKGIEKAIAKAKPQLHELDAKARDHVKWLERRAARMRRELLG